MSLTGWRVHREKHRSPSAGVCIWLFDLTEMSGQIEPDYLSIWAASLELFVHHSPKTMNREREIAWLGISAVPRWGQKHMVQEAWRQFFEKRKWCISNETPTFFSRMMYWQCQSATGCSAGSLKTGKPGCEWQVLHLLSSTSFQTEQAPQRWRGPLLVTIIHTLWWPDLSEDPQSITSATCPLQHLPAPYTTRAS